MELLILLNELDHPLARGIVQLEERDLADRLVREPAPGQDWWRVQQQRCRHKRCNSDHGSKTLNHRGDHMATAPPPLPPGAEARALLHHLLEHGDIVGRDTVGRTIIQLAIDDRALESLMTFDAEAAELEPEPDEEEDGPPVVLDFLRTKVVEQRRAISGRD
jgi:hypothetical protein